MPTFRDDRTLLLLERLRLLTTSPCKPLVSPRPVPTPIRCLPSRMDTTHLLQKRSYYATNGSSASPTVTPILSATSANVMTSYPHSQASHPASRAPQRSFLRSSPTWTASSGGTPSCSHACRKMVGLGFSAWTCRGWGFRESQYQKVDFEELVLLENARMGMEPNLRRGLSAKYVEKENGLASPVGTCRV